MMPSEEADVATATVPRTDRTFVDARGVTIHYYTWAASRPKAVLQIVHGLGEYAGRYEGLAQALVRAGYSVYADDHRGHGPDGAPIEAAALTANSNVAEGPRPECADRRVSRKTDALFRHWCSSRRTISSPYLAVDFQCTRRSPSPSW